jgi:hypothetical protein
MKDVSTRDESVRETGVPQVSSHHHGPTAREADRLLQGHPSDRLLFAPWT